jgi:hypothetical protein
MVSSVRARESATGPNSLLPNVVEKGRTGVIWLFIGGILKMVLGHSFIRKEVGVLGGA